MQLPRNCGILWPWPPWPSRHEIPDHGGPEFRGQDWRGPGRTRRSSIRRCRRRARRSSIKSSRRRARRPDGPAPTSPYTGQTTPAASTAPYWTLAYAVWAGPTNPYTATLHVRGRPQLDVRRRQEMNRRSFLCVKGNRGADSASEKTLRSSVRSHLTSTWIKIVGILVG